MFGVLLFILCFTNIFAGKCTLNFEKNHAGIFWRKFGANHILLEVANDHVEWDDQYEVTGYCSSNFRLRSDSYSQWQIEESALFWCSENQNYWQSLNNDNEMQLYGKDVSCQRTVKYYEASIPMCNDYGLAYGFFVEGIPLVLAGACYNLKSMQTKFLHYVAGLQSPIVEYRAGLNSVNLTTDALIVDMDCINIEAEQMSLAQAVEKAFPKYKKFLQFELDYLISFEGSQAFSYDYSYDLKCVGMIPWWISLKYGNWKMMEDIVAKLARHRTYDVYTGTSGVMTYRTDEKCLTSNELTYEVNHIEKQVPLYVWKYIKDRNNDTDTGVVIVGINSPFTDHLHRSEKICSDMCEEIPWMEQLQKSRKFAALGYVFCCRPDELKTELDNFPSFERQDKAAQWPLFSSTTSNPTTTNFNGEI